MIISKHVFLLLRRFPLIHHTNILSLSISSPSTNLVGSMKKLIEEQKYQEALHIFDHNFTSASDAAISLALKACTKIKNLDYGRHIHRQLSLERINNPFINTALMNLYSKWLFLWIEQKYKLFNEQNRLVHVKRYSVTICLFHYVQTTVFRIKCICSVGRRLVLFEMRHSKPFCDFSLITNERNEITSFRGHVEICLLLLKKLRWWYWTTSKIVYSRLTNLDNQWAWIGTVFWS